MAMYCLNLMRIALELAMNDPVYQDIATKFFEHFLQIADTISGMGDKALGLWDDEDGFYYDAVNLSDDRRVRLKVRSIVGLIPLLAVETLDRSRWNICRISATLDVSRTRLIIKLVSHGCAGSGQAPPVVVRPPHENTCYPACLMKRFLSDYGVRAVSATPRPPVRFDVDGQHS
jgi:hypothetical protein